jgi:hypothetical protein
MRLILHIASVISIILLALNAYGESFQTRSLLREVRGLEAERDAQLRRLHMLQAEYAYLTRPERLRDLAIVTFDTLGLQEMQADRFATIDEVPDPIPVTSLPENAL